MRHDEFLLFDFHAKRAIADFDTQLISWVNLFYSAHNFAVRSRDNGVPPPQNRLWVEGS